MECGETILDAAGKALKGANLNEELRPPVTDKVLAFRDVAHVAGLHGAGLANVIWGRNSIHWTEFYLPKFVHRCDASPRLPLGHRYANTFLAKVPWR
jgi:hypothetical protein